MREDGTLVRCAENGAMGLGFTPCVLALERSNHFKVGLECGGPVAALGPYGRLMARVAALIPSRAPPIARADRARIRRAGPSGDLR